MAIPRFLTPGLRFPLKLVRAYPVTTAWVSLGACVCFAAASSLTALLDPGVNPYANSGASPEQVAGHGAPGLNGSQSGNPSLTFATWGFGLMSLGCATGSLLISLQLMRRVSPGLAGFHPFGAIASTPPDLLQGNEAKDPGDRLSTSPALHSAWIQAGAMPSPTTFVLPPLLTASSASASSLPETPSSAPSSGLPSSPLSALALSSAVKPVLTLPPLSPSSSPTLPSEKPQPVPPEPDLAALVDIRKRRPQEFC